MPDIGHPREGPWWRKLHILKMANWYRYIDVELLGNVRVLLVEYPVTSENKAGTWLDVGEGETRLVYRKTRKPYAHATIEEAKAAYIERKKSEISQYARRITLARQCMENIP